MNDTIGAQPGESKKQRVDRELRELLEEIRVALPGIELLLGFLLILPFTDRFAMLDATQRAAYLGCFLLTALTIALFVAPTANHRLRFREIDKEHLLVRSNRQIIGGLLLLAVAIALAGYIVTSLVIGEPWSYLVGAALAGWCIAWWFLASPR